MEGGEELPLEVLHATEAHEEFEEEFGEGERTGFAEGERTGSDSEELEAETMTPPGLSSAFVPPRALPTGSPHGLPSRPPLSAAAMRDQQSGQQSASKRKQSGDKVRLKNSEYGLIVDWLEVPENFAMLVGQGRRTKIGGKYPSKKTVFKQMLTLLHDCGFPKEVSTGENLGKRYSRYLTKYKEALSMKNDSGAGLTQVEQDAGISFEEKLDKICPHFSRMHVLFGERANVNPPVLGVLGMPGHSEIYQDQVADDDEDVEESPLEGDGDTVILDDLGFQDDTPAFMVEEMEEGPTPTEQAHQGDCSPEKGPQPVDDGLHQPPPQSAQGEAQSSPHVRADACPGQPTPTHPRHAENVGTVRRPLSTKNERKGTASSHAQSKPPNIAQVYSENMKEKSELRAALIEKRDKWKAQDLEDRKEARLAALREAELREAAISEREMTRDKNLASREVKKARLEGSWRLKAAKEETKRFLLVELFKSGQPFETIEKALSLLD